MTDSKVEIEVFRSWEGCRWCWSVKYGKGHSVPLVNYYHGVEDTLDMALAKVRENASKMGVVDDGI